MPRRRSVAALLGALVLLAGCTDEATPKFEPTESPSPTEATTSAEPQAQTPEEFIEEWVELDREMQTTGEVDAYLAVSDQCDPCRQVADQVADIYASGGRIETRGWAIDTVEPTAGSDRYRILGQASAVTIVESAGSEPQRLAGGPITYEVVLEAQGDSWRLVDLLEVST